MKLVKANGDKPHRCPCCHGIDHDMRRGFGSCARCRVWWWERWSTLRPHRVVCPVHGDQDTRLAAAEQQ